MKLRLSVPTLGASAALIVALLVHEGYSDKAIIPVPGDVPTVGFGTTGGVKMGDTTTPVRALQRAYEDLSAMELRLRACIRVPLYQHEYDAFLSLSSNIGTGAFCGSTLVRKLNAYDYAGACKEILRWDKFKGKPLAGLTKRRQAEYRLCTGGQDGQHN
jgi:lysozyme